jgi:hypothetical protein
MQTLWIEKRNLKKKLDKFYSLIYDVFFLKTFTHLNNERNNLFILLEFMNARMNI